MKNKIGITFFGEVPLEIFAKAINHFQELIKELSLEIEPNANIEWQINELEAGSATAGIISVYPDVEKVERIVTAYEVIGKALSSNRPIPYNEKISDAAKKITSVIDGKVDSIEFFTPEFSSHIDEVMDSLEKKKRKIVYGTVTGLVETVSRRQTLRFMLYDKLFDKAVKCIVGEDRKDLMRDIWDKQVIVTGQILRETTTGKPIQIKEIESIEIITDKLEGNFLRARGVIPWKEGSEYAEDIIRRIRDEE